MSRRIDLTGQRFNRWTVLRYSHTRSNGSAVWGCRCDCGTVRPVLAYALKNGSSRSCGCLHSEVMSAMRSNIGTGIYRNPAFLDYLDGNRFITGDQHQ